MERLTGMLSQHSLHKLGFSDLGKRDVSLSGLDCPFLVDTMVGHTQASLVHKDTSHTSQTHTHTLSQLFNSQAWQDLPSLLQAFTKQKDSIDTFVVRGFIPVFASNEQTCSQWLGLPVHLSWLTDARIRDRQSKHLVVQQATLLDQDGALAYFQIILQPIHSVLNHTTRHRVFADKSALDIASEILGEYGLAYDICGGDAPALRRVTQWGETDWQFIVRILSYAGFWVQWQYTGDETKLVILDNQGMSQVSKEHEHGMIKYGKVHAVLNDDRIHAWNSTGIQASHRIQRGYWNHRSVAGKGHEAVLETVFNNPQANPSHSVDDSGHGYTMSDTADSSIQDSLAEYTAIATQVTQQLHTALSSVKALQVGSQFNLVEHPSMNGDYRVLGVVHMASNANSHITRDHARFKHRSQPVESGSYRNRIQCIPAEVRLCAYPIPQVSLPPMTASIRSSEDRDHRHGAEINVFSAANATKHEGINQPVRLRQGMAGNTYGNQFANYAKDEVLINSIGNANELVIQGSLPNTSVPLNYAPIDNQSHHSGYLHTDGGTQALRWQHTPQASQIQLYQQAQGVTSQLTLGQLNPSTQGLQLSTTDYGSVRTGQSLYVTSQASTHAQTATHDVLQHSSNLTSQSLGAVNLHERLSQLGQDLGKSIEDIDSSKTNLEQLQQEAQTEGFTQHSTPHIFIDSPANTVLHAQQDYVTSAGQTSLVSAQTGINLSTQKQLNTTSHNTTHFIANKQLAVTSSKGTVDITAHTGKLQAHAKEDIDISSSEADINIYAQNNITIHAGTAKIELQGNSITITANQYSEKASQETWHGSGGVQPSLASLPVHKVAEAEQYDIQFTFTDDDGVAYANVDYVGKNTRTNEELTGTTDKEGNTEILYSDQEDEFEVILDLPWQNEGGN